MICSYTFYTRKWSPSKETCHCGLEKSATFPVSFQ